MPGDGTAQPVFDESCKFSGPFPSPRLQLGGASLDEAPFLFSGLSCVFSQKYLGEELCTSLSEAMRRPPLPP